MSNQPSTSAKSSITTRQTDEAFRKIDLIGYTAHQIVGAKLPSNRQVLKVFFHNMRFVDKKKENSANLTVKAVLIFWLQARIPTRYDARCAEKLLKMYENWKYIQKNVPGKRTPAQREAERKFVHELDDLFDIAHADALTIMRNEEDKQFLLLQRQKGRPGCMVGVDKTIYEREKRALQRREKEEERREKYERSLQQPGSNILLHSLNTRNEFFCMHYNK